jgi:hypothetical protein
LSVKLVVFEVADVFVAVGKGKRAVRDGALVEFSFQPRSIFEVVNTSACFDAIFVVSFKSVTVG